MKTVQYLESKGVGFRQNRPNQWYFQLLTKYRGPGPRLIRISLMKICLLRFFKAEKDVLNQEKDILKTEKDVLKQENEVLKREILSFFPKILSAIR